MFRVTLHKEKPISWWFEQYGEGKLDMGPTYQRKSDIWTSWKKSHLIDSILNDFDIPKFYVADFSQIKSSLNEKRKPYAIIDGKQRFEAIFSFLSGDLALNQTFEYMQDPEISIAGLAFPEIKRKSPSLASKIEEFVPTVMSVITDEVGKIQEMFVRLNSGEATTRAERRNAMPGPIPQIVRDLTVHPFFQQKISFDKKRMQEFNLAAKLLLIEYRSRLVDTKAKDLDAFAKEAFLAVGRRVRKKGAAERPDDSFQTYLKAEERVLANLERLSKAFDQRDRLLGSQGHIPVYYWFARENRVNKNFKMFLEEFTLQVRENMQLARKDPDNADTELLSYYTMGRTTNDQKSLEGRYEILSRHYGEYLRTIPAR